MTTKARVIVLGLDGGDWGVLTPWMDDGTLPNLRAIRDRGVWGDLESTLPPLTPPAWASFLTGKNPAKHGVFHFARVEGPVDDLASGSPQLVDGRDIRSATIWDIVAHNGGQLVTINVPMSYPPRPVNGVMVTCLLTPADADVFTYPPELSALLPDYRIDLERFIGEKPFARDEEGAKQKRTVEPSEELLAEFKEMEEIRGRTAVELARSEPWDLFTVVFTAPDRMGHYLWPYHHLDAGADDAARRYHAAIRDVYRSIDDAIGRLVEVAGPEAHVVVLSDHGMGATHSYNVHWNSWLLRRGLLRIEGGARSSPDALLLRLGLPRDRLGRWLRRIPGVRSSKVVERARSAPTVKVDAAASSAYFVRLFDPLGGIRVAPHLPDREAVIAGLLRDIAELKDPASGRPIATRVLRREDYFRGPFADRMPDVLVLMDPDFGSSDRVSAYSAIVTPRPAIGDSGAHQLQGVLMLAGPDVRGGGARVDGATVVDVAPTILHLLRMPIPDDMDGAVLVEAERPEAIADNPVRLAPPGPRWPSDAEAEAAAAASFTSGDPRVRDRLRDLGYVE